MSSLRSKKGPSGRHNSEGDAHTVSKHQGDMQHKHSISAQSSPRHHQRMISGEQNSHSRRSPSTTKHSPKFQNSRQSITSNQDLVSAPQLPPRPPKSSGGHRVNTSKSTANVDRESPPVFSPRNLSPSAYSAVEVSATSNSRFSPPITVNSNSVTPSRQSPSGFTHHSRTSPSTSSASSAYTYAQPMTMLQPDQQGPITSEAGYQRNFYEAYKREYYDTFNQPGSFSSLPRQFPNFDANSLNRGSPAYSSARYQAEQKRKASSLNRHASFHTQNDMSTHLVSPLTRRTPPSDIMGSTRQQESLHYGYDYPRKYSLPVTSQHSLHYTSMGKSNSGSQLPNVRGSQYPPLREDTSVDQMMNHSTTQGDYLMNEETLMEYGFPTFYSQWVPNEHQYTTRHHQQGYESLDHHYGSPLTSHGDSRSRHPSLPPDPSLKDDRSLDGISDLQGSVECLSLHGHQSTEKTHRRSRSCDASKAQQEGFTPSPYEQVKSRHHSLIRRQQHSYEDVKRERLTGKLTGDAVSTLSGIST